MTTSASNRLPGVVRARKAICSDFAHTLAAEPAPPVHCRSVRMTTSDNTAAPARSANKARRDPYADLLRDTRGLRREQAATREAWFASLPWERKEETLFELEMLM